MLDHKHAGSVMSEAAGLAAERQAAIAQMLKQRGVVRVEELCDQMSVSPATIRRDLADLASRGYARRVHGGAVSIQKILEEPVFDDKTNIAGKEKQAIAEEAFKLVNSSDSVFLDGGSTVLALARMLVDMSHITVVTNSFRVAATLSAAGPRLILIGGELRRISQTFVGPLTENILKGLHVDTAFMGTIGLSEANGLTTTDPAEAFTKRLVISRAHSVVALADSTKLGKESFSHFADLKDIGTLITDDAADPDFLRKMAKRGVNVICSTT
jgi:DeoR/GlpR family transcriptional regulator of sugar metabolism